TLVAEAAMRVGAAESVETISQLRSARYSAMAWTRARCARTHSLSITAPLPAIPTSDARVSRAQASTCRSEAWSGPAEVSATRSWLSWPLMTNQLNHERVVELVG